MISRDNITNDIALGGLFTDTSTAYTNFNGHAGTPADPIVDDDIQQEVEHAISVNNWPTGFDNFFAVFTENGIESCADSSNCTPGANPPVFCAYHSVYFNLSGGFHFYANMPFVNHWGGCQGNANGRPNLALDVDADREISTFSHELFEAITDPLTDGIWTDSDGGAGEIADKCNQHFDSPANADGSNLSLHGNLYNVQPEWSNATANTLSNVAFAGCTHGLNPADMDIVKNGPSSVFAGASFDYTVDVNSNTSPTAETPHFTDALTSNLLFISVTKPNGWTCNTPSVGTSGPIDCFLTNSSAHNDGFMNSGDAASFTVTSRVKPSAPNGSTVSNTGNINWDTKYTQDLDSVSNVQLSEGSTVTSTVVALADLTISKATVGAAIAGASFGYIIDVENDGPSDAQSVTVTDTLPAGLTFVSTSPSGGFSCVGTTTVTCTVASMGSGALASIAINVKIASGATGSRTNTASVTSTTNDPNTANNSDSVTTFINTEADVQVTKTGPSTPTAGTDVTYTVTATNLGPSDAQTVALTDTIAAPATFVSITTPAGWSPCVTPAVGATGLITCNRPTLPAGVASTFTLVVHISPSAPTGSQLCNTAAISTATTDPGGSNNSSTACGTVQNLADLGTDAKLREVWQPRKRYRDLHPECDEQRAERQSEHRARRQLVTVYGSACLDQCVGRRDVHGGGVQRHVHVDSGPRARRFRSGRYFGAVQVGRGRCLRFRDGLRGHARSECDEQRVDVVYL